MRGGLLYPVRKLLGGSIHIYILGIAIAEQSQGGAESFGQTPAISAAGQMPGNFRFIEVGRRMMGGGNVVKDLIALEHDAPYSPSR